MTIHQLHRYKDRVRAQLHSAIRQGKILPAKEWLCAYCLKKQANVWHHISYVELDPRDSWEIENYSNYIMALCYKCHALTHKDETSEDVLSRLPFTIDPTELFR